MLRYGKGLRPATEATSRGRILPPARRPAVGVPSRCPMKSPGVAGGGFYGASEPGLLRRRPVARFVLIRAQLHYTTRHYATVVQSQKCAAMLFWLERRMLRYGKGLRPATEATSRGRILPPTRRTPAPLSVASREKEVAHLEHVVDRVGVGVVEVVGGLRQNGEDVVAIDLDLRPPHVPGVAELAPRCSPQMTPC